MNLANLIPGTSNKPMHLGDSLAMWDVLRNKIIGVPTLVIYYSQAKDKDLKDLIKYGLEQIVIPTVQKLQKELRKDGITPPDEPNIKDRLRSVPENIQPNTMMKDDEIAVSLRELTRLTMSIEAEALRNATRPDVRRLMSELFETDNNAYSKIIKLNEIKGWLNTPPYIQ